MAGQGPHTKLINAAAREALKPLGLRQKGRSRTWLDDQGWWLGIVEFQHSQWSKGAYLNVSARLLWHDESDELRGEVGGRVPDEDFVEYTSDSQFERLARELADTAAREIGKLRERLSDVDTAARSLAAEAEQGWPGYDACMAFALAGEPDEAVRALREVITEKEDAEDWWQPTVERARGLLEQLERDDGEQKLRREATKRVRDTRKALKLPGDFDPPW